NAQLSFPSGHASGTMAPLAYVTLLCLSDVRYLPPIVPSRSRSILGILATIPVMISFAIGVTRILDTWHFVHDVFGEYIHCIITVIVYYVLMQFQRALFVQCFLMCQLDGSLVPALQWVHFIYFRDTQRQYPVLLIY
ncbi:unnamed protein product, partial [Symbiodinium microadriaticum]